MAPRLRVLTADEVADAELKATMEQLGRDDAFGVYAHAPELFKRFLAFLGAAKYGGAVPFELKELVRLRIAAMNDCER